MSAAGSRCRQDLQEWAKPAAALSRQPAAPGEPAAGSPKLRYSPTPPLASSAELVLASTSHTKLGLWITFAAGFAVTELTSQ